MTIPFRFLDLPAEIREQVLQNIQAVGSLRTNQKPPLP